MADLVVAAAVAKVVASVAAANAEVDSDWGLVRRHLVGFAAGHVYRRPASAADKQDSHHACSSSSGLLFGESWRNGPPCNSCLK